MGLLFGAGVLSSIFLTGFLAVGRRKLRPVFLGISLTVFTVQAAIQSADWAISRFFDEALIGGAAMAAIIFLPKILVRVMSQNKISFALVSCFIGAGFAGNLLSGTLDQIALVSSLLYLKWVVLGLIFATLFFGMTRRAFRGQLRIAAWVLAAVIVVHWSTILNSLVVLGLSMDGTEVSTRFGVPLFSGLLSDTTSAALFFMFASIAIFSWIWIFGPTPWSRFLLAASIMGANIPLRRRIGLFLFGGAVNVWALSRSRGSCLRRFEVLALATSGILAIGILIASSMPQTDNSAEIANYFDGKTQEAREQLIVEGLARAGLNDYVLGTGFASYASIGAGLRGLVIEPGGNPRFQFDSLVGTLLGEVGPLGLLSLLLAVFWLWLSALAAFRSIDIRTRAGRDKPRAFLLLFASGAMPVMVAEMLFTHSFNYGFGLLAMGLMVGISMGHGQPWRLTVWENR